MIFYINCLRNFKILDYLLILYYENNLHYKHFENKSKLFIGFLIIFILNPLYGFLMKNTVLESYDDRVNMFVLYLF